VGKIRSRGQLRVSRRRKIQFGSKVSHYVCFNNMTENRDLLISICVPFLIPSYISVCRFVYLSDEGMKSKQSRMGERASLSGFNRWLVCEWEGGEGRESCDFNIDQSSR
jgi:hypothetical protein